MKHIKIVQYHEPDFDSVYLREQHYRVYIGIRTVYFTNEVKAKAFIAETNRMLNDVLHSANYFYYNLFTEYRKAWFYIDSKKIYQNMEDRIFNMFCSIEKSFNWIINRAGTSMNGNVNAFNYLDKSLRDLILISNEIKIVLTNKSRSTDLKIIDVYINQITDLLTGLNNWGKQINMNYEFLKQNEI